MSASDAMVLLTIASVAVGCVCVLSAFALFMYGRSRLVVLILGVIALITITVIPVCIAVFYGATVNS